MKTRSFLFIISLFLLSCKEERKDVSVSKIENEIIVERMANINLSSGTIERVNDFPSSLIKPRNVDIWLPENYSKDKKYAVLYMHDGQMLFDSATTWNKQEWKVDEVASQLIKDKKVQDFIVVGVWNIRQLRNSNYFPEKVYNTLLEKDKKALKTMTDSQKAMSTINSNNYLKFLVKELKPFIDNNYFTKREKEHTFIMGSSRGGLISMYAISEYPEVFGGAACLSTHWIGTYSNVDNGIPESFINYMEQHLPDSKENKLYFDYGTETLDEKYLPYQEMVTKVINEKGHSLNKEFAGTDHSENSWAARLDVPLTFLLGY